MLAWLRRLLTGEAPPPEAPPEEPTPAERLASTRPPGSGAWIGVDLDGTLARAEHWQGMESIGEPVPAMMRRVRAWVDKGLTVKVVTARAGGDNFDRESFVHPSAYPAHHRWHGLADGLHSLPMLGACKCAVEVDPDPGTAARRPR